MKLEARPAKDLKARGFGHVDGSTRGGTPRQPDLAWFRVNLNLGQMVGMSDQSGVLPRRASLKERSFRWESCRTSTQKSV